MFGDRPSYSHGTTLTQPGNSAGLSLELLVLFFHTALDIAVHTNKIVFFHGAKKHQKNSFHPTGQMVVKQERKLRLFSQMFGQDVVFQSEAF